MSASPAHRTSYAGPPGPRRHPTAAASERRRRERHFARRRRDLLEDIGAALVLTVLMLSLTAGLGVIALVELAGTLALTACYVLERRKRRKRLIRRRAPVGPS
jgi:Flp pilus assembly protein TadB